MTDAEIRRWFRLFRYDPQYRGTVPIALLCHYAGVPRPNLYLILRGELGMTRNYHDRLVAAIRAVEDGLRWRKNGRHWEMVNPEKFQALPRYERPKHRSTSLTTQDRRDKCRL
ncbi:MAG TPA: hypothetical protein VGH29_04765 [Candidatus Binataceae bacterium]|jgi:hypothetical protein